MATQYSTHTDFRLPYLDIVARLLVRVVSIDEYEIKQLVGHEFSSILAGHDQWPDTIFASRLLNVVAEGCEDVVISDNLRVAHHIGTTPPSVHAKETGIRNREQQFDDGARTSCAQPAADFQNATAGPKNPGNQLAKRFAIVRAEGRVGLEE